MSDRPPSAPRVHQAHGDAWQQLGRIHAGHGGGAARLPGIRLMASGLPHPQWNNGDVDDPALVDIAAVAEWYAVRGVSWGVRVPAGMSWPYGRRLFGKRLMGLTAEVFEPAAPPPGITVRPAGLPDLDGVLAVDTVAFESSVELERPWLEPLLSASSAMVAVACEDGDRAVGTGYAVVADGDAGRTVYVAGIAVLPAARRRGVGAALSSWLAERGFAAGADLAHLHPDTDEAASIYRRLGFVEVDGFDVYVDNRPG